MLIFDIRALWRSTLECQKLKMVGLDQYGDEPFKQRQFVTAGVEGVKELRRACICYILVGEQ